MHWSHRNIVAEWICSGILFLLVHFTSPVPDSSISK